MPVTEITLGTKVSDHTVTEIMMRWDDQQHAASGLPTWVSMAGNVLKALAAAGYVIVPRVPTEAMLEAAMQVAFAAPPVDTEWAARIYTALLQAAEGAGR